MLSSPRNSVTHNQQAKLAVDYNELLKELSSHEMTSVGCYTIGETIGEGTFGKVKKGFHKLTGRLVAIKKISKQHAPMMAREIHHHRQLKHSNIVMLYEMITTESAIHIISEYCPNGDLLDALTDSGRCSESRVHKWFRQLTDAIKYCHTRGIVHRDLKLENILLDAGDNIKICDFGFARFTQKNQYLETFCGSLSYSAPEVILRKKYTGPETDIWSLGVILYTLLAGEYPFDDDSEIMTQRKIVQVEYEVPFYFSCQARNLIQQMLQLDPSQRITIDGIVDHAWMMEEDAYHVDYDEEEEENDDNRCLTPSSSTTTNQSNNSDVDSIFSNQDLNTIALEDNIIISSPDLKFSPQVRSSLGMTLRPSSAQQQQQQQQQQKSPRFSAPSSLNRRFSPSSPLLQSSFRTSLPSSFHSRDSGIFNNDTLHMNPIEQKLFAALTTAGFDKDALIKMQTGECDTSSTLWHLLLENMMSTKAPVPDTLASVPGAFSSVPDAFASAIQSRNNRSQQPSVVAAATAVDCGVQTSSNSLSLVTQLSPSSRPIIEEQQYVQPYPKPPMNKPQNTIHTVGFGSSMHNHHHEKSGWFSSVKSWFGSKQQQQQQQLQLKQQQNELIISHQNQRRSRSSSMSSPIASPSSYRNFDIVESSPTTLEAAMMMSPPIYRTGSTQKYRRRVLLLSEPPVSELDQLTYNGTFSTNNNTPIHHHTTTIVTTTTTTNNNYHSHVNMPPTALTSTRSLVADTFSILNESLQPKEIDMCEKRYSMMYNISSTPPPSPPTPVTTQTTSCQGKEKNLSDFSSDSSSSEEDDGCCSSEEEEVIEPIPVMNNRPRSGSNRFEFAAPRSRLSIYGMQEPRGPPMGTKTIIEEEEEEED